MGENAQTALLKLIAALPLAECPGTEAVRALSDLFPHGDFSGKSLGLTVQDEIFGGTRTHLTVCRMTDAGIYCKLDSRGPLSADAENYSTVIDRALENAGFMVIPSEMDAAHYVPEDTPLVQKIRKIYETVYGIEASCQVSIGASYAHYIEGAVSTGAASYGVDTRLHKPDEFMYIEDLLSIGKMYTELILEYCR